MTRDSVGFYRAGQEVVVYGEDGRGPHSFSALSDGAAAIAAAGLTSDELAVVVAYLVDGERQRVIGERIGKDQSNVSRLIARCIAKLRAVGVPVEAPRNREGRPRKVAAMYGQDYSRN